MVFWGAKINPKKPFKLSSEYLDGGELHLSQATLGLNPKGSERTVVACKVGDGPKSLLCSLTPGVVETCSLDLLFDEDVLFSVIGSSSVHLTGYYLPAEIQEDEEDEYDDDFMFQREEDESNESMSNDESQDNDLPVVVSLHSGVKIEEIFDESNEKVKKLENANIEVKQLRSQQAPRDEEQGLRERADAIQKQDPDHITATIEVEVMDNQNEEKEDEESEDEDGLRLPQKRKTIPNEAAKRVKKTKPEEKSPVNLDITKKKKKKAKDRQRIQKSNENGVAKDSVQMDSLCYEENINSRKLVDGAVKENRKGDLFVKAVSAATKAPNKTSDKPQSIDSNEHLKLKSASRKGTPVVKRYPNGFEVEEISMGKPDGTQAKPGKRVSMHYVGKLKSNGKIFDSNTGKKPFEFRLGVGEVIKGWDLGVNGMRVGDKRRLTIPPQMGYGASGVPGTIPQNAWLIFEAELVSVK